MMRVRGGGKTEIVFTKQSRAENLIIMEDVLSHCDDNAFSLVGTNITIIIQSASSPERLASSQSKNTGNVLVLDSKTFIVGIKKLRGGGWRLLNILICPRSVSQWQRNKHSRLYCD